MTFLVQWIFVYVPFFVRGFVYVDVCSSGDFCLTVFSTVHCFLYWEKIVCRDEHSRDEPSWSPAEPNCDDPSLRLNGTSS